MPRNQQLLEVNSFQFVSHRIVMCAAAVAVFFSSLPCSCWLLKQFEPQPACWDAVENSCQRVLSVRFGTFIDKLEILYMSIANLFRIGSFYAARPASQRIFSDWNDGGCYLAHPIFREREKERDSIDSVALARVCDYGVQYGRPRDRKRVRERASEMCFSFTYTMLLRCCDRCCAL